MSESSSDASGLPRLAFVYHPRSFATLAIAEAAAGICQLIWVVDTEIDQTASMAPLLRRLGSVVDIASLSLDQAAAAVAAERPDGILALADPMLLRTAEISSRLGLGFLEPRVAERLTDKNLQRSALREAGLPVPRFWLIPDEDDRAGWDELERQAVFPAVLKPRRGEGSRDTTRVRTFSELRSMVAQAQPGELADRPELVLEEYLEDRAREHSRAFADYVSVESVVVEGEISHLAITGRFPPAEPFRETGFFIPSAFDEDQSSQLAEVASAAVKAIGVTNGVLHTEIKFTPQGPRVIELNGRIGGGVPEMLADATGIQLLPIAIRVALGERIDLATLPHCAKVGYLLYVQAPLDMRTVRAIDGLDRLREHPWVQEVTVNRGPGHDVDWRTGNHGHVFSVRGSVADHEQLREIERYVKTEVKIEGD